MTADLPAVREIAVQLPKKLGFLLEQHRYKIVYGGRGGAKSWSVANALLTLGANQKLRILCAREIQRSIKQSVHKLLSDRIQALGLGRFYTVLETEIRGTNGTEFSFTGLSYHTADTVKSFEAVDIVWVEEAQTVPERSWRTLIPTIRAPGSEIWITFNPDMDSDPTWRRFIINTPDNAALCKIDYDDNKWFPIELDKERVHCQKHYPDDYDNIWRGKCRTVIAGAIFAREVIAMYTDMRARAMPYDPRLPVHTVWDLGWNDAMSIIMLQKPTPTTINIINYMEDSFRRYDEYIADMKALGYHWGTDWLPHDGANGDSKTGKSAKQVLQDLGRKVKIIPRSDPEARIRSARMMFPRVYVDDSNRMRETGHLGGARLLDCLKRYRRNVPRSTDEAATPVHDQHSHAADAFGGLAEIVDQIRNDGDVIVKALPAYKNPDLSMGVLG